VTSISISNSEYKGNKAETGGSIAMYGSARLVSLIFSANSGTKGLALALLGNNSTATLQKTQLNDGKDSIYLDTGTSIVSDEDAGVSCSEGTATYQNNVYCCPEDKTAQCEIARANNVPSNTQQTQPWLIPVIVVGGVAAVALVIAGVAIYIRSRRTRRPTMAIQMHTFSAEGNTIILWKELEQMVQIGRGAFGVVYRAGWREINVAVKQLLNMDTITPEELESFSGEVMLLQGLRPHPNLVMFLGISISPDPIALITEFCEGGMLLDFLVKHRGGMEAALIKKFILGIASGMLHLHTENIVHRDLAARNVLLTGNLDPKISDFGLSRKTESAESASKTQSTVGPLKWMAPEAIVKKQYSGKSDVFSFSMTMWEIMSGGEELYPDLSVVNAAIAVTTQQLRPPVDSEMKAEYPRLVSIMTNCWNVMPEDRPSFKVVCGWLKEESEDDVVSFPEDDKMEATVNNNVYSAIVLDDVSIACPLTKVEE